MLKHRFKLMPLKEGSFMHSHIGCYALLIMSALSLLQVRGTEFETTIRPLLSNACFQCHGPDAAQRKAGLRLDQESEIKSQKDGQWIIDPDQRHQGLLLERIFSEDPEEVMPPPDSGKSLTQKEKEAIRKWVAEGAPWGTHWSFKPMTKPPLPSVKDIDWPTNPIDFFILADLESRGIRPSKPANKATLARRIHQDLIGLPPTIPATRQFSESEDPADYSKMIDGLLSNPAFGEKLSVHWLDLVRYADTVGYHGDQPYTVWPFRDYVIHAFNQNMPFDQFTKEQIAGDLLPNASQSQKIASGFNRLHMITAEGGAQDKEYLAKYAADRVRTTSNVWLGATMGCAECHDHKFDPYTMEDFYSFAAFFGDLKEKGFYGGSKWEPEMPVPSAQQKHEKDRLSKLTIQLEKTLSTLTAPLEEAKDTWEQQLQQWHQEGQLSWDPILPEGLESDHGTLLTLQTDGSILTQGPKPEKDHYTLIWTAPADRRISAIRLDALQHPSMDKGSLSRGGGNFVLSEVELILEHDGVMEPIEWLDAETDYAQKGFEASKAIDENPETGWAVDGHEKHEPRSLCLTLKSPLEVQAGHRLTLRLKHETQHEGHMIGRFRLSSTPVNDPTLTETGIQDDLYRWLITEEEERDEAQNKKATDYFLAHTPLLEDSRRLLSLSREQLDRLDKEIPTMLVSKSVEPRTMRILPRGNWMDESGPEVVPALPAFLPSLDTDNQNTQRLGRLDLARWLTSKENPLTARVFVNRLWKLYFGHGLARVMEDSGSQGSPPTHPALLDWLACEFIDSGWDIKHMIQLMVGSSTYQQTSQASDQLQREDPENKWFARQSSYRLDAEMIRDQALELSGLLTRKVGGESARPYQPEGYYSQLNFPKRTYQADLGSRQYRRGLYTHWQRTFLHPMLKAFDAPNREECTASRPRSNTPLQSLNLLNDPSFVEAAEHLADRILENHSGDDRTRIAAAFEKVTLRRPNYQELSILQDLLNDMRDSHEREPRPQEDGLVQVGMIQVQNAKAHEHERHAWISVTRALLNLHETITRY